MFSEQRRVVTLAYLLTVFATLYSSLWVSILNIVKIRVLLLIVYLVLIFQLRSTLVTIFFSIIQAIALVW